MLMSKLFVQTLREFPNDAEAPSHKLLVRAGYIKKLTSGIYSYLPLMQRVLAKVSQVIREEMNKAGAQELLMPFVQPAQIWEKSGRWSVYAKKGRLKTARQRYFCANP
jgi:prolyl-tRNA synthetase